MLLFSRLFVALCSLIASLPCPHKQSWPVSFEVIYMGMLPGHFASQAHGKQQFGIPCADNRNSC